MNNRTLKISGEGTIFNIKVETHEGKFKSVNSISIYVEDGKLVVYSVGRLNGRIPLMKEVQK